MFAVNGEKRPSSPSKLNPIGSSGCETLLEGAEPVIADVVFVHGLHGHRRETWTKNDVCWPKDLLAEEEKLSNIRVLTFGYDANVDESMTNVFPHILLENSFGLLNELARVRKGDLAYRPIFFVAHSVGGLLVKEALHDSYMVEDTRPDLGALLKATTGIIFLGTPHRGYEGAARENMLHSIKTISMGIEEKTLIQVESLSRNATILDRIQTNFALILLKRTFRICTFTEELPMSNLVGKVVEAHSGVIGDTYEMRGSIHANHIQMVKFSRRDDSGYRSVLFAITTLVIDAQHEGKRTSYKEKEARTEGIGRRKTLSDGFSRTVQIAQDGNLPPNPIELKKRLKTISNGHTRTVQVAAPATPPPPIGYKVKGEEKTEGIGRRETISSGHTRTVQLEVATPAIPPPPIGCKVLHEWSNPVADIIFVHGLCGHRTKTWTKDGVCWPMHLLPGEEGVSNTRIISFGYDGNIGAFSSRNSISDHSRSLLKGLGRLRALCVNRPLIFVAHSIGGLVVKKMLQLSFIEERTEPTLANILKATKALIFISTPHRGADIDAWKNIIENVASAVSDSVIDHTLLDGLRRNSPTLDDLGTDFSKILFMAQFRIFSFYEELPMIFPNGEICTVLTKDSAVIGEAKELQESIHANHLEIVKFGTKKAPGYKAIVDAIKRVIREAEVGIGHNDFGTSQQSGPTW